MLQIVPRRIENGSADVFVGGFSSQCAPSPVWLNIDGDARHRIEHWHVIDGGRAAPIFWWSGALKGLEPGIHHRLSATVHGTTLASANVEALPAALPRGDQGMGADRPFTIWLSSCYAASNSPQGLDTMVQRVVTSPRLRPHIKCLVGDQVYLDELFLFIYSALSQRRLRSRFNQQYARTWLQPAFSRLLSSGATYCLPDDHEFWNNHPETPFGLPFRSARFWRAWRTEAHLARLLPIQAPRPIEELAIGDSLSICLADMRSDRSFARGSLMTEGGIDGVPLDSGHVDALCRWLANLRCPGVLITQQPLIGPEGHCADRQLTDYDQYWRRILPALHACRQDVVVLCGDTHHGLVATATAGLPDNPHRIIQVVSSPLSLVNPIAASTGADAPRCLPASPGFEPAFVDYPLRVPTYRSGRVVRTEEHAMTISFFKRGDGIVMRVQPWLARAATQHVAPTFETTLRPRREARYGEVPASRAAT